MARVLGLILFLLAGTASAQSTVYHETKSQARAACLADAPNFNASNDYVTCTYSTCEVVQPFHTWEAYQPKGTCVVADGSTYQQHAGTFHRWNTDAGAECDADADPIYGPYHGAMQVCYQGCRFEITDAVGNPGEDDAIARFQATGSECTTCPPDDPQCTSWCPAGEQCDGPPEPEPDPCHELGSGFKWCPTDPPFCVRSPGGGLLCPDQNDCRWDSTGIICRDKEPPRDDWEPQPDFEYCKNTQCIIFKPGFPRDDEEEDDDDDEPGCPADDPDCDEEEEDEPDCPPNDPDCEDDDDDDAPRASDSGCENESPSCSDMGHVDCQILIRTHRTNCSVAHGNKMLEEFRDRQIEEIRESNAKLKALKEQFVASTSEVKGVISNSTDVLETAINKATDQEKQTTEKLRDLQRDINSQTSSITGSLSSVQGAVNQARTATGNAISGQTAELSGKLDQVRQAVEGINPGNTNIVVDQTQVVSAIQSQTAALIGDGVDPSSGATEADMGALQVRSVTDGPVGPSVVDMTGFVGSSCPAFDMGFTLGGVAWQLDNTLWCDFLSIINACMHLLAAWWAVMILLGK